MSAFDGMVADGADAEGVVTGAGVVVVGVVVCAKTTVVEHRVNKAAAVTLRSLLVIGISSYLKAIHIEVTDLNSRSAFFFNGRCRLIRRWNRQ